MSKYLIVILAIGVHFNLCGQQTIFPYLLGDSFTWDKVEVMVPESEKAKLLKSFPKDHFINNHRPDFLNIDSIYSSGIHVIDLDDDKKLDFVYNGYFPGEGQIIEIYHNTENGYKKIFTDYQRFLDIEFENKRLKRLIIDNPGCCADPVIRKKVVDVVHEKNELIFKTSNSIEMISGTVLPDEIKTPIEFETINESYFLRSSPEIKNEPFDVFLQMNGNQIAILKKGTRGRMIGEQMDDTGRIWWFVEIYPEYKLFNNAFYADKFYENDGTRRVGWMSSRFVKKM